ncbi:uncharacterized protein J4E84_004174 [Alternaria hordeiaustralica]|uniref:uncharacterized protein n=1 Tax=Alternaria hordeiaustralica TaxID=1187925 RepID=UPI0020C55C67|nr:uncharacterized protein J4E84_004174 [Alternaria hordeiaustralica]KAI4689993.1 hypothetical protein J4E84_004174 [Alternaria hordeiaustralica]
MHRAQIRNDTSLLQGIKYFEPFVQLNNIGSIKWRKSLRFLVLYYFLEQKLIDRTIFTRDGLESLQRACTSIAEEAIRMGKKTARPLLVVPKNVQITEAQTQPRSEEDDEDEDFEGILVKREDIPAVLVKAPENDSMGAVSTMLRRDDNVAARPFPKSTASQKDAERKYGHAPAATIFACETKRKRSADEHTTREKEHGSEEDPKLVCSRFKRLAQTKIENLQTEATAIQDTLDAHATSLNEAVMAVSNHEKALVVAKARLETVQAAKAATETRLEEVRNEVIKKSWIFQEGFESFYG